MKRKIKCKELALILIAMLIIAAGIYYIMMPANLVIGSTSGLVMVIANFIPLPVSVMTFMINGLLLLTGYLVIGKEFGGKTALATLLLPMYLWIFEHLTPNVKPLTNDPLIDAIAYLLVLCLGQAILFRQNASSGGTDIVAKLINKFFYVDLGTAVMITGFLVAGTSVFVYDKLTIVISLIGTYFSGILLNNFLGSFSVRKKVCIISTEYEKIQKYILDDLHRGCTFYKVYGGLTNKEIMELVAILQQNEYGQLMEFMHDTDPGAFVTVYNVGDVFGFWNDNRKRRHHHKRL